MPSVQQTAALRGLRPVAKAFGASVGEMYSRGIGWWAFVESSRTMRYIAGCLRLADRVGAHRPDRQLVAVPVAVGGRGHAEQREQPDVAALPDDGAEGQQDGEDAPEERSGLETVVVLVHVWLNDVVQAGVPDPRRPAAAARAGGPTGGPRAQPSRRSTRSGAMLVRTRAAKVRATAARTAGWARRPTSRAAPASPAGAAAAAAGSPAGEGTAPATGCSPGTVPSSTRSQRR